ncbi:hypothetical protein AD930_03870 [Acetobacter malorum]|nr:hypothetical protein AD930_03870 [Acetobacter malorum]
MASCFAWGVQAKGCASIGSEHGRACTVSQSLSASVAWGGGDVAPTQNIVQQQLVRKRDASCRKSRGAGLQNRLRGRGKVRGRAVSFP